MVRNGNLTPTPYIAHGGRVGTSDAATTPAIITVLLVEDNASEARVLQEILKGTMRQRFVLVHTNRLADAIAYLAHMSADVALLDLTLPDSVGLASLDSLIRVVPNLPIVVLTNTNDEDLAVEAVRRGAQDYLIKRQVNLELLVRSLLYAIERKQAAEALRVANEVLEHRVQERTAELKVANDQLHQEVGQRKLAQEHLELAQKAGKIGTVEWNLQSNTLQWSSDPEQHPSGGFLGDYQSWLQMLHPDDRSRINAELQQAVRLGQELDTEFRLITPGDDSRWTVIKGSVFPDETGQPWRMIGIHMDITDRKNLEAKFLRAQRLESLGTLASGIAHDLNNILTPILAVAQLLPMKLPHLDHRTGHLLDTLEASAKRGAKLVKQILSFAKGVEGKRITLKLDHVLTEVKAILDGTLPKSIIIRTELDPGLWSICGDATQLHQVIMNLCVNARDAMPNGGILTITAHNQTLAEHEARQYPDGTPGDYVVVTVTDTGAGIPSEIQHRIFDPFFTTKEIGKGTGLGLSAVLGITKSHYGFVDVQHPPQGSEFRVFLPACDREPTQSVSDLNLLSGHQELILVVDDELAICEITKTTLELHNYQVLTALNGEQALTQFAEHSDRIHCVLMDLMMPLMDGLAAISLLKRLNPDVYVIAMSGINSTETVAEAKQLGFQGFLAKPFTNPDLLNALAIATGESVVSGSRAKT